MQRTDDVEFIEPLEVHLAIDDTLVTLRPLTVRQIPQLLEVGAPLLRQLAMFDAGALERFRDGAPNEGDLATLMSVLAVDAEDIFTVFAICSGQSPAWVGGLLPDRFAHLAAVCLEVNRDFFSRALPPAALRALAGLGARPSRPPAPSPGETASSSSPPPGTDTATSSATPSPSSTPT